MSQNDYDPDENDVRDESMSHTTRRGLLGALGVAGLASLGSGSASAQLGGGPEADAMSEYRVPTYRVPESDLDSPGIVGRRVEITSGGATYDTGDQLVDLGDRWELVSPNYESLSAEKTTIGDGSVSGGNLVLKNENGTTVAEFTPSGELLGRGLNTDRTWQDVTSSRSFADPETNGTGIEIGLYARADTDVDGTFVVLNLKLGTTETGSSAGYLVDKFAQTIDTDESAIVRTGHIPPGVGYQVEAFGDTSNYSLTQWTEFRPNP